MSFSNANTVSPGAYALGEHDIKEICISGRSQFYKTLRFLGYYVLFNIVLLSISVWQPVTSVLVLPSLALAVIPFSLYFLISLENSLRCWKKYDKFIFDLKSGNISPDFFIPQKHLYDGRNFFVMDFNKRVLISCYGEIPLGQIKRFSRKNARITLYVDDVKKPEIGFPVITKELAKFYYDRMLRACHSHS